MTVRQGLAEQHPRRFVVDADIDADGFPFALQNLFEQFARAVAGGGGELERQGLAVGVLARAIRLRVPPGIIQELLGRAPEVVAVIAGTSSR